jgi:hypothetical protein
VGSSLRGGYEKVEGDSFETLQKSPQSEKGSSFGSHAQWDITPCSPIYALVAQSEDFPDGKVELRSCCSDETDEDYITPKTFRRLKLKADKNGKVTVTWILPEGKKIFSRKFAVWPDKKELIDAVFSTRVVKGKEPELKRLFPGISTYVDSSITLFIVPFWIMLTSHTC